MVFFAAGVATVMLALAYGTRSAIAGRRDLMRRLAGPARPMLGLVFVAVGLAVFTRLHYAIEGWALTVLPAWLIDLSVAL